MAIKTRFFCVITKNETLDDKYPAGSQAYLKESPDTRWSDGKITASSYMGQEGVQAEIEHLEKYGFIFEENGKSIDIAVSSMGGITLPCSWLQFGETEDGGEGLSLKE